MGYKIGDKVVPIRRDGEGSTYRFNYTTEMESNYCGKVLTIVDFMPSNYKSSCVTKPDDGFNYTLAYEGKLLPFSWASSMFRPLNEPSKEPEQRDRTCLREEPIKDDVCVIDMHRMTYYIPNFKN